MQILLFLFLGQRLAMCCECRKDQSHTARKSMGIDSIQRPYHKYQLLMRKWEFHKGMFAPRLRGDLLSFSWAPGHYFLVVLAHVIFLAWSLAFPPVRLCSFFCNIVSCKRFSRNQGLVKKRDMLSLTLFFRLPFLFISPQHKKHRKIDLFSAR